MKKRETIPVGHTGFSALKFQTGLGFGPSNPRLLCDDALQVPFPSDIGIRYVVMSPDSLEVSRIYGVPLVMGYPAHRKEEEGA